MSNPTKVPLLPTQVCLSEPPSVHLKVAALERTEAVGPGKDRDGVCRRSLTATTARANSTSATPTLQPGRGYGQKQPQCSRSRLPLPMAADAEKCLQAPSYSTAVWQPRGMRRPCGRLTGPAFPNCHILPPWWRCPTQRLRRLGHRKPTTPGTREVIFTLKWTSHTTKTKERPLIC